MSGVLKPMIHSLKTITPSDPIGIDHIVDVAQLDIVVTGTGGGSIEYALVFNVNASGGQTPREIVWKYANDDNRNGDLSKLLSLFSTVL